MTVTGERQYKGIAEQRRSKWGSNDEVILAKAEKDDLSFEETGGAWSQMTDKATKRRSKWGSNLK